MKVHKTNPQNNQKEVTDVSHTEQVSYMTRAINLAKKAIGKTNPNPLVGAVLVKEGQIIGEGYHQAYGEAHAEINALSACQNPEGATLYVTLEPCSHYGKTPPCTEAIIQAKVARVVVGMLDPNPLVAGAGVACLEEAGIEVYVGVLEEEVQKMNRIFTKYITTGLPYCMMKTAMTLDGKIAAVTGHSKWVTGPEARQYGHSIRQQVSAIMVGIGTVLADNPRLTTRLDQEELSHPLRVILDTTCRIPLDAALLKAEGHTLVIVGSSAPSQKIAQLEAMGVEVWTMPSSQPPDLTQVMRLLGKRGIDSVLLEGGSTLNGSALEAGVVDEVFAFIAPKIIGGEGAKSPVGGKGIPSMEGAILLRDLQVEQVGPDVLIRGYLGGMPCLQE